MFQIRVATHNDIGLLQKLAREIWMAHYSSILSNEQIEYMLQLMYSTETIEQELASGVIWQISEVDSTPVGFISYTCIGDELKLNKLYILPGYHGNGFGQRSLAYVMEYARLNHLRKMYLTVNKNNEKAIKAYEKAGMIRTDSKVFDIGNGYVMDDYIYTYFIRES